MPLSPHAFYKDSRIGSLPRSGLDDVTALALSRPTGITAPPGARPTIKSRPWIFPARLFSGYLKMYGMISGYRVTARYDTAGDFLNSTSRRGMTGAPHRHHDRAQTKNPATRRSRGALLYRQCRYRLLVQGLGYVHGASYGATYHGVVTDTEEAHHLYVGRYR